MGKSSCRPCGFRLQYPCGDRFQQQNPPDIDMHLWLFLTKLCNLAWPGHPYTPVNYYFPTEFDGVVRPGYNQPSPHQKRHMPLPHGRRSQERQCKKSIFTSINDTYQSHCCSILICHVIWTAMTKRFLLVVIYFSFYTKLEGDWCCSWRSGLS